MPAPAPRVAPRATAQMKEAECASGSKKTCAYLELYLNRGRGVENRAVQNSASNTLKRRKLPSPLSSSGPGCVGDPPTSPSGDVESDLPSSARPQYRGRRGPNQDAKVIGHDVQFHRRTPSIRPAMAHSELLTGLRKTTASHERYCDLAIATQRLVAIWRERR